MVGLVLAAEVSFTSFGSLPTRIANNDSPPPPVIIDSQENQTTCLNNYGISKQGKTDTRVPITPSTNTKPVREQSNDEWLADADAYF